MSESGSSPMGGYREQIVGSLTPVRPIPAPSQRVGALVPLGVLVAIFSPLLYGSRGDLSAYTPHLTWGVTGLQLLLGIWLLTLAFREAVPGRNVSGRALALAIGLTTALVLGVTVVTNLASATVVPPGRAWQYWAECMIGPMAIGAPFMILATLMAARAFPTRPAITGALCGVSAGVLSDAGWRLSCWISEPTHILSSHGLAIVGLAAAGAWLAVSVDAPRWRRLRAALRNRERIRERDARRTPTRP